jgi:hypothetical protein
VNSLLLVAILVVLIAGLIAWRVYLAQARHARVLPASAAPAIASLPPAETADWTRAAGEEFTDLSEAERCDLVFAFAALDDPASEALLERALEDPSEAVELAAARAFVNRGRDAVVERVLATHSRERAHRIKSTLELLA